MFSQIIQIVTKMLKDTFKLSLKLKENWQVNCQKTKREKLQKKKACKDSKRIEKCSQEGPRDIKAQCESLKGGMLKSEKNQLQKDVEQLQTQINIVEKCLRDAQVQNKIFMTLITFTHEIKKQKHQRVA